MASYQKLKNWSFTPIEQSYTVKDTMLYALSAGYAFDPLDPGELRFAYEKELLAVPTMAIVLASPGFWLKEENTGIDWKNVLHGEQGLVLHAPLPTSGRVKGELKVLEVVDRKDQGLYIYTERKLYHGQNQQLLATMLSTTICRGDGHLPDAPSTPYTPWLKKRDFPKRACDLALELPTLPQQALFYRLNGDHNPLHADPQVAQSAGFARPILHGLCTFAVAGHALLRLLCWHEPQKLCRIEGRFSAPVYPGEMLRTEVWREEEGFIFRVKAMPRDVVVFSHGFATLQI